MILKLINSALIFSVFTTISIGMAVPAAAKGSPAREIIVEILEINGWRRQVEQIPAINQSKLDQIKADPNTPEKAKKLIIKYYNAAFNPKLLYQYMVENLVKQADMEQLSAVRQYLNTKEAEKVTALEVASDTPEGNKAQMEFLAKMNDNPPPKDRLELVRRLDTAALVSGLSLEMMVSLTSSLLVAMDATQGGQQQLTPEKIKQMESNLRKKMAGPIENMVLGSMLHTYQTLSDEEFERYIAFYESKTGGWYAKVMAISFLRSLYQAGERASEQIKLKSA